LTDLRRDRDQSELQKLKANNEGSIDLDFGLKAPPGKAMKDSPPAFTHGLNPWLSVKTSRWSREAAGGAASIKYFFIGGQPFNARFGYYANVVRPDPGPDWTFRFQIGLLLPKGIF
jgi:hypothetical protein